MLRIPTLLVLALALCRCSAPTEPAKPAAHSHAELVTLFREWREFQLPKMIEGVPDYSAEAMKEQQTDLTQWQQRLNNFDTVGWPIRHQVDWYIVYAEMNGLDFDHRVIQPWVRDPAFYVWFYPDPSDVPEREGPNIHGRIELPAYGWPLASSEAADIAQRLRKAPAVFEQARKNLTGNARDLWVTGIRSIRTQSRDLQVFADRVVPTFPDLAAAAREAKQASDEFAAWLEQRAVSKTGPSGVGKENYTWYVKKVHLVPHTYESEEILLKRELQRAHQSLRFAEHRNRKLPPLKKAETAEQFHKQVHDGISEYIAFLKNEDVLTILPYMDSALRDQARTFTPPPAEGVRGFFDEVDYRDPMPLRAHHFHWFDKAHETLYPNESPIRQAALLYNIFDSRCEGLATAWEELVMHEGLLESRPRTAELVYIMLAQRAARALGGLYQHGLEMDFKQATELASKWVPWGLLPAEGATIQHEEQFYLQQPHYGSSYVIGKIDLDRLIAEYARQREGKFVLREFMDDFSTRGLIPLSLLYWEMTGDKSMLNEALN